MRILKPNKIALINLGFMAVFFLISAHIATAQPLEVTWPSVPGATTPTSINTPLPVFFQYLYTLGIIIAGALCFVMAVWGGVKYILAGPNPGKLKEAREQIGYAFVGMMIILGSWMLLNTINPDLLQLDISLPVNFFPATGPTTGPNVSMEPELIFHEIPVGTLITSEYLASSFLKDTGADINYASTTWPATTSPPAPTSTYPTDFQGALYGGRLKRIHEVASTSAAVAEKLSASTDEIKTLLENGCECFPSCQLVSVVCTTQCEVNSAQNPCSASVVNQLEEKVKAAKHLKDAFRAFLNPGSLVKDYYDNNKSDIDGLSDSEIQDLIQLMIEVEKKGSYTPKTDPPERDVGRNLFQEVILLDALKKVKRKLNPLENEPITGESSLHVSSFAEATSIEQELQIKPTIVRRMIIFLSGTEIIKPVKDPATFYSSASLGPPSSRPYVPPPEPDYDFLNFLNFKRAALAQATPTPAIQFGPEPPLATAGTYAHLTEIPIGTALDEAIKLTERINGQLFEIFLQGHLAALRTDIWQKIAEEVKDMDCKEACSAPPCIVIPPDPVGACVPPIPLFGKMFLYKVGGWLADTLIGQAADKIKLAFEKIDSQKPIGKEFYCPDEEGNCRDNNNQLDIGKLKEREYTLKEKLVKVQKLLNMARELVGQQEPRTGLREESKYDLLLENLIDLGLAEPEELAYVLPEDKLDLQNCHIFFETVGVTEEEKAVKDLLNCWDAKMTDAIDVEDEEECSPDPYLDTEFFMATTTRERTPLNCLCYDEDADRNFYNKQDFPELYITTLNLNIPDFTGGLDVSNIWDIINIALGSKIEIGGFIGFGNNFYCAVSQYEE